MPSRSATLALAALVLATGTGCSRVREVSQCRAISAEVNPVLAEVEGLSKRPGGPDQLGMAKRYAGLAKQLKARSEHAGPLAAALREYASVLEAADAALRAHEEATRSNQPARVAERRRELERLVKRERSAVARIDSECQS